MAQTSHEDECCTTMNGLLLKNYQIIIAFSFYYRQSIDDALRK